MLMAALTSAFAWWPQATQTNISELWQLQDAGVFAYPADGKLLRVREAEAVVHAALARCRMFGAPLDIIRRYIEDQRKPE